MLVYCFVNKDVMRFYIDVSYHMIIKSIKSIIKSEIKISTIVHVMNFEKKSLKSLPYPMLKFSFLSL